MASVVDEAELYWRYVAESSSTDRATRLRARDVTGELGANFEALSERIRLGGAPAAEAVIALAASARSAEQVGFLAAGPCEDLHSVDAASFIGIVLPAIAPDLARRLADGMILTPRDEERIRASLR